MNGLLISTFGIARKGWGRYRKKGKSLTVTLSGVFFIITFFISLFSAINENLWKYWVDDFIGGHFIIDENVENYDFFHPLPPEYFFSYREFLETNPELESLVAPHLKTGALLESRETQDSVDCIITGIDLEKETGLNDHIRICKGRFFQPGMNEIIVPESIGLTIGAELGDEIVIFFITEQGYFNYDLFTIVGFIDISPAASYFGQYSGFVPIDTLRGLLMSSEDTVSELLYVPGRRGFYSRFRRPGYRIVDGLFSFSVARAFSLAFKFLEYILFLLIFSFVVTVIYHNVVLINEERITEIGVYLTYGAGPYWVKSLMFLEIMIYTAYCALWGGIVSWLFLRGINSLGIYPIDMATEIVMASTHFTLRTGWDVFLRAFLVLLFLVGLGSYRPIWKMANSSRVVGLFTRICG